MRALECSQRHVEHHWESGLDAGGDHKAVAFDRGDGALHGLRFQQRVELIYLILILFYLLIVNKVI
jgi:hypothetical protein